MTRDPDRGCEPREAPLKSPEIDVSRVLWMSGDTLPSFVEVDGRKLVLITLDDYKELTPRTKLLRQTLGRERPTRPASRTLGLSTIERDPDVADYIAARFYRGVTLLQV